MPKLSNQKLKLIYLMKILLERTDETHSITMPEIIDALAAYDISAERKSLYNDIKNSRVYMSNKIKFYYKLFFSTLRC